MTKKSLILGAAMAATLSSGVAMADVTGNIGIGSNYVWRGFTQTADQAATWGGLDWSDDSGVYAGTWVSNVDFTGTGDGYEMDFYAGFSGEAGDVGYDVGIVTFAYPVSPGDNFTELYINGSFNIVTVSLNLTVDNAGDDKIAPFVEDDMYISISADVTDNISIYFGTYMFEHDGKDVDGDTVADEIDYEHFGVSLSMGDFAFTLDKNTADSDFFGASDNNMRATVSWGKEFEM